MLGERRVNEDDCAMSVLATDTRRGEYYQDVEYMQLVRPKE